MKLLCCVGLCLLAGASGVCAQNATPPPAPPKIANLYYAGTVTECTATKISVTRRISGKLDRRTFRITPATKIEGKLQTKVRVTVQYTNDDQGITATRVVVHAPLAKK